MVTLCMTDYLTPYADATVLVHNLGGNIPYEIERMDHRSLLDSATEELPSSRIRRAKVFVDCNSVGAAHDTLGAVTAHRGLDGARSEGVAIHEHFGAADARRWQFFGR